MDRTESVDRTVNACDGLILWLLLRLCNVTCGGRAPSHSASLEHILHDDSVLRTYPLLHRHSVAVVAFVTSLAIFVFTGQVEHDTVGLALYWPFGQARH